MVHKTLNQIVEEVSVEADTIQVRVSPESTIRLPRDKTQLARFVYLHYHSRDYTERDRFLQGRQSFRYLPHWEDPWFADRLIDAFSSQGVWHDGWRIERCDSSGISVSNGSLGLKVAPGEILVDSIAEGEECEVKFPPFVRYSLPGWCSFVGDAGLPETKDRLGVRVYWGVRTEEQAIGLVAALSERLNAHSARFSLKVVNDGQRLARSDAMVLYMEEKGWLEVRHSVIDAYSELDFQLSHDPPGFTKRVAPGVGMAQEGLCLPSVSFGQHLARIVAEALLVNDRPDCREATLARIYQGFKRSGIESSNPNKAANGCSLAFEEWRI
jgi:hypothetical protein